jgi:hypothetical protein
LDVNYQFAQMTTGTGPGSSGNSYSLEFRYAEVSEKWSEVLMRQTQTFNFAEGCPAPINFSSGWIRKLIDSFVARLLFAIDRDRYNNGKCTAEATTASQSMVANSRHKLPFFWQ